MNEYRPKPPRKSKSQQSQPGMIKYRKCNNIYYILKI